MRPGEARVGARPWFDISPAYVKAQPGGGEWRAGRGSGMRDYRNTRPAFAPPPPEPGAGSSRAVGRGKGPECHGTLRGPRAGEMEEGGRTGIGWASTEERRTERPQSLARPTRPCLLEGCRPR